MTFYQSLYVYDGKCATAFISIIIISLSLLEVNVSHVNNQYDE